MAIRTLIALDIDGVLNTHEDHQYINQYKDADVVSATSRTIKFYLPIYGNKRVKDLGMYINRERLSLFHAILNATQADVLGISSWFGGGRDDLDIAAFLKIPLDRFIISEVTSGGKPRCRNVAKVAVSGEYDRLIVIDDQNFGWDAYGIDGHRLSIDSGGLMTRHLSEVKELIGRPINAAAIFPTIT